MIHWAGQWQAFERDDAYFLRELAWEVEPNPAHPLHGKRCRIAGWIPGYDHFILYVKGDGRYAYVQLIWRRDEETSLPYCEFLGDTDAVSRFVDKWCDHPRNPMLPLHRIVTTIPLRELWNDRGPLPMRRVRALSASDVREFMRLGLKDFCVADVGHPLEWLDPATPYELLKHEVLPRLVEPASAEKGFSLDDFPGGYAYLASEWQDDAGGKVALFEKYH